MQIFIQKCIYIYKINFFKFLDTEIYKFPKQIDQKLLQYRIKERFTIIHHNISSSYQKNRNTSNPLRSKEIQNIRNRSTLE